MRTGTERDADYGEKRTQSPHRLLGLSTYSQPVAPCAALRREPYARRGIRYGPNGADIAGRVFREQNHLTPNVLGEWSD